MAKERKKRKRKSKSSGTSGGGGQSGGGQSGGGVLQGIRTGIRRATGVESQPTKPSKTSNIVSGIILVAAIAFLLYRFYG